MRPNPAADNPRKHHSYRGRRPLLQSQRGGVGPSQVTEKNKKTPSFTPSNEPWRAIFDPKTAALSDVCETACDAVRETGSRHLEFVTGPFSAAKKRT